MPEPSSDSTRERLPKVGEVNGASTINWLSLHFDGIDKDKNGTINQREIEVSMQEPKLATASGGIYLSAMHDQLDPWKKAFEQQPDGKTSDGFTKDGIKRYEQARANVDLLKNNAEQLKLLPLAANFTRVDTDLDGRIDMPEIDRALKRRDEWAPGQVAMLEVAKANYDRIKSAQQGISRDDIQNYPDPKAKELIWLDNATNYFTRRLNEVYSQPAPPISQGMNNSCFFIAPMLQLHLRDSHALKSMIKDNSDGTRTVTFPGDKEHPYTVAAPTDAELATYSNNRDAATLEKAFGLHWYQKKKAEAEANKETPPEEWPEPAQRLQFGQAEYAMKILTGKDTESKDPASMTEEEVHRYLEKIHESGRMLTIGSKDHDSNTRWGLVPKHEYLASYDPKTRTLTVTNPLWLGAGTQEPSNLQFIPLDGKNDRTFEISIPILRDRFFQIVTTTN